ncbi:MAG: sulfite exporter TauE/SafE family protein, partial [Beijerinckiaceae bacterium]
MALLTPEFLLPLSLFLGALLYTSVGHAGASAYIAAMALLGTAPAVMRPTALVLNIIVASLTSLRFWRAKLFDWTVFWPVALGAIPAAFMGGMLQLPPHYYRPLVGAVLLIAAVRLLWPSTDASTIAPRRMPIPAGIAAGAAIGLLSGLTGTGGGIFLSPLLIFLGWAPVRIASGIAAVFILCNSIAGLLGNIASVQNLPRELPIYAGAVLLGALIGSHLGINRFAVPGLAKMLGV